MVQYTGKNGKRNYICYEFERNGACLRKGCKFINMNRNAAYPNYSDRLKDRNPQNMPKNGWINIKQSQKGNPDPRDVDHQLQQNKICLISVEQGGANTGDPVDMFTQTQRIRTLT